MTKRIIKQGSVFMANLDDNVIDSEMMGSHPVIIASIDIRNDSNTNVFIFPITHSNKKRQPTHWKLYQRKYEFFQYKINTVLCEEGRSISKRRICRYMGEIDEEDFKKILECSKYIFEEKDLTSSV